MRRLLKAAVAVAFALVTSLPCARAVSADFSRAGSEVAEILSRYIQIDTTNPPGNEQAGAEYLAWILQREGIEPSIIPIVKGRACVYARLHGSGRKKAVVLLSHIDVVPAQARDWKYPPFAGEIHDGELWGRGAIDMKSMAAIELEAMLLLKRNGVKLDRDVIFLATPDEEAGGPVGAGWFKQHRSDLVKDAEFLLNEGFCIEADSSLKPFSWDVDVAEKSVLWLKLTAKGMAGHASMPLSDSAPNRLVRALARLAEAPVRLTVLPVVQEYCSQIASAMPPSLRQGYKDIATASKDASTVRLLLQDKLRSSMMRNTVSLTVIRCGYKTNVIPAEATAELDCRLLPGVDHEQFIAEIKEILNDPSIDVSVMEWEKAVPSPARSELFDVIKKVAAIDAPGVPVVPAIAGWFTDSHWFRELGIVSYGFQPLEQDAEHLSTMHGKNERVSLRALTNGVRRMYMILDLLCSSRPAS